MHNVTVAFAALLVMLLSYFFGCFNGSFMVSHFIIRDDVRKHGSGNAGLTNFYRTYGAKYALLVIACDMGKTVAACLLGSFFFRCLGWDGTLGTLLAGLGCELGPSCYERLGSLFGAGEQCARFSDQRGSAAHGDRAAACEPRDQWAGGLPEFQQQHSRPSRNDE